VRLQTSVQLLQKLQKNNSNKIREFLCHHPPSGTSRGGGSNAITSQGGRQEAVVRQHVEAPADMRWPLGCSALDYEALLADPSGLSSGYEACAKLYNCARHGKVNACQLRLVEGDCGRGISSSTDMGNDGHDNDDGNLNCRLASNKRLKATDDGGKRSSCQSDGEDHAKIGGGDRDDDNRDMNLALEMMDTSWSMLFSHATTSATTNNAGCPDKEERVPSWAAGQLPRVLHCIGNRGDTTIK
jgi:hypothetical protein